METFGLIIYTIAIVVLISLVIASTISVVKMYME